MDKATLISPDGEIRDVAATMEELTPLLAAGWRQHLPPEGGVETEAGETLNPEEDVTNASDTAI